MSKRIYLRIAIAFILALIMAVCLSSNVNAATTGIVSGTVTDMETGEKLQGVNVIIEGTGLTTVTDENGYYVITNVPPGDHKVIISLVGYKNVVVPSISVIMDATETVDAAMEMAVAEDEEEVIVEEARPMVRHDVIPTMYVVDDEDQDAVKAQANTLYQTPGLVATLPGVVPDADGYPHIRGGRQNEIGYMLDGIAIIEPVTNGFGTNTVNVGMDKMEMYTGGYRPEYGNSISGIFNQVVKSGRTNPGESFEFMGGEDSFWGFMPEVGGISDDRFDYYMGAYVWRSDFRGIDLDTVDSSDAIGKFNYQLGKKDKATLLLAGGSETYIYPYLHTQEYGPGGIVDVAETNDYTYQRHFIAALTLTHTINPSSFVVMRPYFFKNRWNMQALSDDIGYWWDAGAEATGLQVDYTNQVSPNHLIKVGGVSISSNNDYWANVPYYEAYGLGKYEYVANTDTLQTGLYAQDQMVLGPKWRAEVGVRYDRMDYDKEYSDDSSEHQLSPRAGISYAVNPNTNLRFSYGRMIQFVYTQAIERYYTDPDAVWGYIYYGEGTGDLKPERCTQYDLGWERQVSKDCAISITPFYREYTDLLQSTLVDPDNPDTSPIVFSNLGTGTSQGVEVLVRKRASSSVSGWLAYTYSIAKAEASSDRDMIIPGVYNYVDWDQRHTAALVVTYDENNWVISLMGQYGSGLPYTPDGGDTNSARVGSHTVFNLNVGRKIQGGFLRNGTVNLGVANVFDCRSPLTMDGTGTPIATVPPRFINLSYTKKN